MNIPHSVRKAILDWQSGELDSSMLHACNAVDGTARKKFDSLGNKQRFTRLVRENYSIIGPMGMPGIDLDGMAFPVVVKKPTAPNGKPDLADVIYGIHRCTHAHGDELPDGFQLNQDASGPKRITTFTISKGKVNLSDRIIFGLIAIAVLSTVNSNQAIPELKDFYLYYGNSEKMFINEWWGRAADFPLIVAQDPMPLVKMDLTSMMPDS